MKKIIILLMVAMLLIVGCTQKDTTDQTVEVMPDETPAEEATVLVPESEPVADEIPAEEEPAEETPTEEEPEEEVVEEGPEVELNEGEHMIGLEESATVEGKKISVTSMKQGPEIVLDVDGTSAKFTETKSEEIIEGLTISVTKFIYGVADDEDKYVILKVEPFVLGENEYLLDDSETVIVKGIIVELVEARTDGSIYVSVKPSTLGKERIIQGESKVLEGIEISPVKTFTKDNTRFAYAIVKIVPPPEE